MQMAIQRQKALFLRCLNLLGVAEKIGPGPQNLIWDTGGP